MRASILLTAAVMIASMVVRAQDAPRHSDHERSWVAPAQESVRSNPLSNDRDAEAGGARLFRQRCSTCHGDDAGGTAQAPSLVSQRVQRQGDGALFWKISTGNTRSGMPTFSFLPPLQRWQLVLHLRARARAERQTE